MPLSHTTYGELTEKQLTLIGRLVIEWSNIEFLLGGLLSRLLFTPEFLGRVYSDEMPAAKIQTAINKAVEIHRYRYGSKIVSSGILDEIMELNREAEKYRGQRNRFAHFCWMRSNDEEIFGTSFSGKVPSMKGINKEWKKLTVSDLQSAYDDAYQLVERLSQVIQMIPEENEVNA